MSLFPHIESYPDEFWMNVIRDVVYKPPGGGRPVAFQIGINYHWPSLWSKSNGLVQYGLNLVWNGISVDSVGWFDRKEDAAWLRDLLLKGRRYACPHLRAAGGNYITIDEKEGRVLPSYPKSPYYNSFDPTI